MPIPSRRLGELTISQEYSASTRYIELPAHEFLYKQGVSSIALLVAALAALAWANSPWSDYYFRLWEARLSFDLGFVHLHKSLHHWINDGLMSLFFFLVGMEIKHEMAHGQLSSVKRAALPVFGAVGGMVLPAAIFLLLNFGSSGVRGWGIPMATDIAFAAGVMALVPGLSHRLKIFLLALAIVDDIGAILVIAVFYTETLKISMLALGAVVLIGIWVVARAKVTYSFPYVLLGILFWMAILESGVHATIAGVILAFTVSTHAALPRQDVEERANAILQDFRRAMVSGDVNRADVNLGALETLAARTDPPIERITRGIHPWVAFIILPIFAFANSGVLISHAVLNSALSSPVVWGIVAGLVLGKPIGIVALSWFASRMGWAEMPPGTSMAQLIGAGMVAGVGFTVAIFIANLAYSDEQFMNAAKIGILLASTVAGLLGYAFLRMRGKALSV